MAHGTPTGAGGRSTRQQRFHNVEKKIVQELNMAKK